MSWEGGIRGSKTAEEALTAMERGQKRFGADLRFHLRFETFAIEEQETTMRWLEDGRVSMLVFNDHLPQIEQSLRETPDKMQRWAHHLGIAFDDFRAQVSTRRAREDEAEETVRQIANLARRSACRPVPTMTIRPRCAGNTMRWVPISPSSRSIWKRRKRHGHWVIRSAWGRRMLCAAAVPRGIFPPSR